MIPYALGLGALLGALTQLSPWAFLGLLGGLLWPQSARWLGLAAYSAVLLRLALVQDPWAAQIGQWVRLEGHLRDGFLHTTQGPVYVHHFPRLKDGFYVLEGRLLRPEGKRNPGGFDQQTWLRGLGVSAVLRVGRVVQFQPLPKNLRQQLKEQLLSGLSPPVAALASALTLGERRELGEAYQAFQQAGLAHALALSGLHVGILTGFFLLALYPLGPWRYLATILLLLGYLWLVGPFPSLVRAVIMAALVLLGLFVGRGRVALLPALSLALFVHLLLEPHALFSLSAQLSYLAVLGLALVLPRLPRLSGWKQWLWASISLTLAAQLLTLPLLLHHFHQLPLVSPLSNLLVLPLLSLLVPLGFLKLLLGEVLAWAVEGLGRLVLGLVGWLAQGPQLYWGEISPAGFALYYLGVLPLVLALYGRLRWLRAASLSATAALSSLLPQSLPKAELWQLDVGQGDATLVRLPGRVEILVDGGRGWAYPRLERALRALGVDDIDLLVATHPDADHVEALVEVMRNFPVGVLLTGPPVRSDSLDRALRQTAQAQGIRVVEVRQGFRLRLAGAELRFLGPQGLELEDNARSLVFVLEYAGRKALFTGDAPASVEARWPAERVDILKVGHHGAESSTSEELLSRFQPRVALIGVGNNPYGHPSRAVLERLQRHGVAIRRTDLEGAIRIPLR
ncbi:DNA internalization-related competence protein ComEC/Rec2 [Meiothermus sp. QL-1]|uniref:DNA internalization-related competence protein ComEC/Rec2 n=1 Tax=Meiothermus sp. QL-1 TaxID=2058095 RepID=UPI000E0B63FE|nr:DNA internalization-related competence protein ComEC/Rec2 [Meiothermus sp. QL-1]RDI95239.1 DNA internalization-related competence protein ComEC/Rec2 [Meiothermus sp. QL-1]